MFGGCFFQPVGPNRKKERAYAKSLPPLPADPKLGYPALDYDLDLLIGDLVAQTGEEKQLRRWCKKSVVFRLKGDDQDAYRTLKVLFTPVIAAKLREKHGAKLDEILNERYI